MNTLVLVSLVAVGFVSRYDPGVFESVVRTRRVWDQNVSKTFEDGYIAVLDCDLVGETVFVEFEDGSYTYLKVADCAGIADGGASWMQRNKISGEVDFNTAMKFDCVGQVASVYLVDTEFKYKYF